MDRLVTVNIALRGFSRQDSVIIFSDSFSEHKIFSCMRVNIFILRPVYMLEFSKGYEDFLMWNK